MNDDLELPSSKVTVTTTTALIMAIAATVAEATGFDINVSREVALWAATIVVGLVGYFTREKRPSSSAREVIEVQGTPRR